MKEAIRKDTGIRPPFAMEACCDAIRGFVYEAEAGRLREVKKRPV